MELGEMSNEEALEALLKAALRELPLSNGEIESAETLIKELGCLAVALVQAGTYCYRLSSTVGDTFRPYTFTQYLSLFASHRAELMKKVEPTSLDSYERGAYTTLDLSYKELPQAPREFLHLISFFHHTDIPLEAFATAAKNGFKNPWFRLSRPNDQNNTILELKRTLCNDAEWNELWMQEIIQTLHSFSLLTTTSINDSIFLNVHPLIQKWSRDMGHSASTNFRAMARQVLTASASEDNVRLSRNILPHILDMLDYTEVNSLNANDLMAFVVIFNQLGHYQKAARLVHRALEVVESSLGSESITTLNVYSWLGKLYINKGKWNEAERLLEMLLQKRQSILGREHPDTIFTSAGLALTYDYQGRYAEAEKLGGEVLEQRRRILGIEHPETIRAAANLASTYANQGRYGEAEALEMEVLEKRMRLLGPEHPDTIKAAAGLALTYQEQRRYGEAEKLGVEVLERRRRILGIEHPDTINTAANLALTYTDQGRYVEAEKLGAEVLEQKRRILGIEHPNTIIAAANLAVTYHSQSKWNEAEDLETKVLEQRRRILGMEHPDTMRAMANLAMTCGKQGRWEESVALLAPAVQLSLKVLGCQHPHTQERIKGLVYVYDTLGKQKNAEEMKDLLL